MQCSFQKNANATFFPFRVRSMGFALVAGFLSVFTHRVIAAEPPEALEIQWRDSCDESAGKTFFSAEVSGTGDVIYIGSIGVREIGSRRGAIGRRKARGLFRAAEGVLAKDLKDRIGYAGQAVPEPPSHFQCLFLKLTGPNVARAGLVTFQSQAGIEFEEKLVRSIDLSEWVCPARTSVPRQDKYCGEPALFYSHIDKESCQAAHVTQIRADGSLHYYVSSASEGDLYKRVDPRIIQRLTDTAFALPFEEVMLPSPYRREKPSRADQGRKGYRTRWLGLYGPSAVRFRTELERLADVQWLTLPSSSTCVEDSRPFPIGNLGVKGRQTPN